MRYNSSIAVVFFPLCGNTNEQSVFTICCWLVKAQVFSANNEKKWFQSFSDVVGYMNFIIIFFATATTMTKNKLNCWDMEQQSVCVCCSDVPLVLIYPMHCCLWWPQCRSSSSDGIEFPCGKWRLRRIVCRPVQWNFIYTIEKNTHSIHLLLCIWLRRFRACNCIRPFRFIRFCQSNYRRSTKKKINN